jgi:hypothetical protein
VDIKEETNAADIGRLCDELFEREMHYFNPQKISKQ